MKMRRSLKVLSRRKHEQGYTLLELLVVILILALIIAIAAPKVVGYFGKSKTRAAEIQISNIMAALDLYRLDVGKYPTKDQGLKTLVEAPANVSNWDGPYLTRKDGIIDPWGNAYIYTIATTDGHVVVMSYGADAKPGGSGEDRDVTSDH
jgi:general secretion pathway protein G